MGKLHLEMPKIKHKEEYEKMMNEWEGYGGRINPGALRRYSNKDGKNVIYEKWLSWIEDDRKDDALRIGNIPQDLYFLMKDEKEILGAISLRKCLDEEKIKIDGHIGIGIRPFERGNGYATKMIELVLPIAKKIGIKKLVYTCDKDNIGSSKVIMKSGGIFEKEFIDDEGKIREKYYLKI
jgi:predicted acetyltransferase